VIVKKKALVIMAHNQSVNYVLIPYLNQEGIKARLIKALDHLNKLEKEEQAKNDPFGN